MMLTDEIPKLWLSDFCKRWAQDEWLFRLDVGVEMTVHDEEMSGVMADMICFGCC